MLTPVVLLLESDFVMCSACAESVFRDKDSVPVQQIFLFLDVTDKDTATMHLGEIAEVRGACCIDECCDDLFTHNDDVLV